MSTAMHWVRTLTDRLRTSLVADEEASLRYAAVDAELDGHDEAAAFYSEQRDQLLQRPDRAA